MVWTEDGKLAVCDPSLESEAPVDWENDVVKIALMTSSYTFSASTHGHWDDVVSAGGELSSSGYTTKGNALTTSAVAIVSGAASFDAADLTFSAIGNPTSGTFNQFLVIREPDSGVTDANTLVWAHATITSTTTNGGDITIQWATSGVMRFV
jgi:hypothetical protein